MSSSDEIDNPAAVDSSGSDFEEEDVTQEPRRKKVGDRSQWAKNIAKRKRDSGEAYVGVGPSKHVSAAKTLGPACTCPKKCYDVVGVDNAQLIFENYWKIACHDAQTSYLVNVVKSVDVKRRYAGQESRRNKTLEYSVIVDGRKIVVCKTAFCNIHAVTAKRVMYSVKKMGETGVARIDMRGKSRSANETPDDAMQVVHDHIKSLPTCSSHYSRAKSVERVYLPPGYTQDVCYELYVKMLEEKDLTEKKITCGLYKKVMRKFNIGAEPPKIDTCNTCDRVRTQLQHAKVKKDKIMIVQLQTEKKLHKTKANVAQKIMRVFVATDEDAELFAVAMDLQQTLATPRLTTSVQYYKRKMWTYNFCIHNLKEKSSTMYVWNEATAKRGSNEIGSCLIHYIANIIPSSITKLIIFSDNCSGQNKNINLSLLLLRFVHSDRFGLIRQYFLMSGHSFMPCDQDFGNLETAFKGKQIYTTPHYVSLMKEARRVNPFTVIQMGANDFVDLQPLQSLHSKASLSRAGFKNGRMFVYKESYKQGMGIMKTYASSLETPTLVKLQKGKLPLDYDPSKFDLASVHLPIKYPHGVILSPEKIADLKHLLQFIPPGHTSFYTDLFSAQASLATRVGEDEDDPDDADDDVLDY